jgi:D-glycero-alpha-D-manno-heptose-7-phosphate kinase
MSDKVDKAQSILQDPALDINEIDELLRQSWSLKRQLADCFSSPSIVAIYHKDIDAGALGGKFLGAGGGGFMMFFVEPANRENVRQALNDYICVDVEISAPGSKIVMYEPNGFQDHL